MTTTVPVSGTTLALLFGQEADSQDAIADRIDRHTRRTLTAPWKACRRPPAKRPSARSRPRRPDC